MTDETQQTNTKAAEGRRFSVRQLIGALVLILFVVFLVENTDQVSVRLIVPEKRISLALALLIAGALGALGLLLIQHRRRRK